VLSCSVDVNEKRLRELFGKYETMTGEEIVHFIAEIAKAEKNKLGIKAPLKYDTITDYDMSMSLKFNDKGQHYYVLGLNFHSPSIIASIPNRAI